MEGQTDGETSTHRGIGPLLRTDITAFILSYSIGFFSIVAVTFVQSYSFVIYIHELIYFVLLPLLDRPASLAAVVHFNGTTLPIPLHLVTYAGIL